MSDATSRRLKVSREGVVLIKSFEGFRPRAVQKADGRWVIGYGHTASAREGSTVSEADAELLLQYDLLPIVKALNERVPAALNQHQFDALASFAISVGVERFLTSDVLQRLNDGRLAETADALIGWPEEISPDARLRRRAAERALFVADPATPAPLADLLAAPLPPPPVGESAAARSPIDARAAAVAALLGETPSPAAGPAEPAEPPAPAADAPSGPARRESVAPAAAILPTRHWPYAAPMVGPLPGFPTIEPAPQPEPEAIAPGAGPVDLAGHPLEADPTQEGEAVFDETPGEPVMRHEVRPEAPRRFDWSVRGAYAVMGLTGLAACAASAAAFRLALADDSSLNDYTVIACVLALIGVVCVGVSAWNLFVQWGRRD